MSENRTVQVGNGQKVNEFRVDSCKRVKVAVWENQGDKGMMTSVQLQKGYRPAGASDYKNMNITFLNRLEVMSAIACLQGALASLPEQTQQGSGKNEYTSVSLG